MGLGYVGKPLANALKKYFKVIGFDPDPKKTDENWAVSDFLNVLADVYIICVPTPLKEDRPDYSFVNSAIGMVSEKLKSGDTLIIESSVGVGFTRRAWDMLANRVPTVNVCYSPERINPGSDQDISSVVKLISGINEKSLSVARIIYSKITKIHECESVEIAEMSKLIENTQRDVNIAFINAIYQECVVSGVDFKKVKRAAMTKWNFLDFSPGLVGGHCIPVDPVYLAESSSTNKIKNIVNEARSINDSMVGFISHEIVKKSKGNRVHIHGASYKEGVEDVRQSLSVKIFQHLNTLGFNLILSDAVIEDAPPSKDRLNVILVNHAVYRKRKGDFEKTNFYDPFGCLDK